MFNVPIQEVAYVHHVFHDGDNSHIEISQGEIHVDV